MRTNNKINFTIILVSSIAALAGLLFGFDTGIISGALLFIQNTFQMSDWMKGFIVCSVALGAIIGSVSSGQLTDKFGRRGVILVISILFIFGTSLAALTPNVEVMLLGRFILGIAIGIGSYAAPLYIAEAAPFEIRGGLVTVFQLMITLGILISYCIDYLFSYTTESWRWMFAVGIIPAVMLGVGMLLLPESPRWLVKQGKLDLAKKTLQYFRRQQDVDHELTEIKQSLQMKDAGFKDLLQAWMRPVLLVGLFLGFLQQVVGINTIIYYAPTIFKLSGFHGNSNAILATVGVGVINVIATIFALRYLDRIGRRPLLIAGLIGMALSLAFLSYSFHASVQADSLRWLAMTCVFTYIACFAFSMGALLWLMVAEIFPLEIRGSAMSVAVAFSWFWNFAVSVTFLPLLHGLGASDTFLLYAGICMVGCMAGYVWVPETKGVSLEQIENNIRAGLAVRDIGVPRRRAKQVAQLEA